MRVLITGAAGFIGSHLAHHAVRQGAEVLGLDDLSTGHVENLPEATVIRSSELGPTESANAADGAVRGRQGHDPVALTIGCISDGPLVDALLRNVDVVFHLAASVGVARVLERPAETIERNLFQSHAFLSRVAARGMVTFVASTSEVYGPDQTPPFDEDDPVVIGRPSQRRWGYAAAKLMGEFLALSKGQEQQWPVVVGRLFNTVGPRQSPRYGMVLPRFVANALRGDPLVVHGDGRQTRSFSDVSTTVDAIWRLAHTPRAHGQVVNIGSPYEISIDALAKRVVELTGSSSSIEYIPLEAALGEEFEDSKRRAPQLRKLLDLIGSVDHHSIEAIVQGVVAASREDHG